MICSRVDRLAPAPARPFLSAVRGDDVEPGPGEEVGQVTGLPLVHQGADPDPGRHPVVQGQVAALEHEAKLLTVHPAGLVEAVVEIDQRRVAVRGPCIELAPRSTSPAGRRPAPPRAGRRRATPRRGRRSGPRARRRCRRFSTGPRTSARPAGSRPRRCSRTTREAPRRGPGPRPADGRRRTAGCTAASGWRRAADPSTARRRSSRRPRRRSWPAASRRSHACRPRARPSPAHDGETAAWRCKPRPGRRDRETRPGRRYSSTPNRAAAARDAG